jgi:hypothetical protein
VILLVILVLGLVIGAFAILRPKGDPDPLAGAPFVTNFVASWRSDDQSTVWTVDAVDPQDDPLTYEWIPAVHGCGTFTAHENEGVWTHPRGAGDTCLRKGKTPDGGIDGSVVVIISDGTFNCTVSYRQGSLMGSMAYPATCVRIVK